MVCVSFCVWNRSCCVCLGLVHGSYSLVALLLLRTTFAPPGHIVRQAGGDPTSNHYDCPNFEQVLTALNGSDRHSNDKRLH